MIIKKLYLIILLLTITQNVFGQYHLTNESSILKRCNVKSLTVNNCIGSGCMKNYYEFNHDGYLIKEVRAIISVYWEWDYYDNGKIKTTYSKNHCCDNDTIWSSTHYYYLENGELKNLIRKSYEDGRVVEVDTITEEHNSKKKNVELRNPNGQIIEQYLGDLCYPCGIIFKGKHKIRYTYLDNGLITNATISNMENEIIVDLEFKYDCWVE